MKICPKCKNNRQLSEYGNCKSRKDGKQRVCKVCQAEKDSKHYLKHTEKRKQQVKEYSLKIVEWFKTYKKTCSCSKCGDTRWYILDFHHIDPTQKDFNIGDSKSKSINILHKEIEKCITLCRNCHTEFHFLERENKINIKEYLNNEMYPNG